MRQLTSLDAQFLALEDGRAYGHVCSVAVLDPSTRPSGRLELADIAKVFAERLHLLPPLRWRLVPTPLGLDHPHWLDDPAFDLEFHLRELHLPAPGTLEQLAEQVSRIVARPLDRARPLWEAYLIGGLEDGRVALMTKLHHALIDGVSGAEILGVLFDLDPAGREIPPAGPRTPDRKPRDAQLLIRGVASLPLQGVRGLRGLPSTVQHLDTLPTMRNLPGAGLLGQVAERAHRAATRNRDGRLLEAPAGRAPRTRLNGRLSPYRRVAFGTMSLTDVKSVKNAFGTTVNDVVVALCAGAVRTWLAEREDLPAAPLLGMIPVSVRTREQAGTFGNRISMMIVPLPTDEQDAVVRLERAHQALRSAKDRHRAVPADILSNANHLIPPSLLARAARVTSMVSTSSRAAPAFNLTISNVPGPPVPMYVAGALQVANFPVSVVLDGAGLNITVLSYQDQIDVGVVGDREMVPDVGRLVELLRNELDGLLELSAVAGPR
jgi:diacylglycerol O-acyltransferase / wax synthase